MDTLVKTLASELATQVLDEIQKKTHTQNTILTEEAIIQNLRDNSDRLRRTGTKAVCKTNTQLESKQSQASKRKERTIQECFKSLSEDSDGTCTEVCSEQQETFTSDIHLEAKRPKMSACTNSSNSRGVIPPNFRPCNDIQSVLGIAGTKIENLSVWAMSRSTPTDPNVSMTNTPYVKKMSEQTYGKRNKGDKKWMVHMYLPYATQTRNMYAGRLRIEARFKTLQKALDFRDESLRFHGLDIIINSANKWELVLVDNTRFPHFEGTNHHAPLDPSGITM